MISSERHVPQGITEREQLRKIVYVIDTLRAGGAERHLTRQLEKLQRTGRYDISVYCLVRTGSLISVIENMGIKVVSDDVRLSSPVVRRLHVLVDLRAYLAREKPAIAHCYLVHAGLLGSVAARLAGVPHVVTTRRFVHAYRGPKSIVYRGIRLLMDACSDVIIAVCEAAREQAEEEGTPSRKLITVRNSVSLPISVRPQSTHTGGEVVFGCIAALHPRKGLKYFLEAIPAVLSELPKARFEIVGAGIEEDPLRQLARDLDLGHALEFLGERLDVPEVLAGFDVFVLPSILEGLPNAILEAMSAGLPVVATRVGGVPEIVRDGVTGLLVEPAFAFQLADAMITLGTDTARRTQMGQQGRLLAMTDFSPQRELAETEAIYDWLLSGASNASVHHKWPHTG